MVLSTLIKLTVKSIFYSAVAGALLVFIPGLPPHVPVEPFKLTPAIKLEGNLAPIGSLDKAELVLDGQVTGAESVTGDPNSDGETVYTGVEGGLVVKVTKSQVSVVAKTGSNKCQGYWDVETCGRPAGIRWVKGFLYTAVASKGILRVDPKNGEVTSIFPFEDSIEGAPPKFPNDLDLAQDGRIFWSDVSSMFSLRDTFVEALSNVRSGRLVQFDPKTKSNKVLIKNIHIANGVQLSAGEDFVLVCETLGARVRRYHLKGPKAGTSDIFIDGLPGLPDNVRASGKKTFYITLTSPRDLIDQLGPSPWLRKLLLRLREVLLLGFLPFDYFAPGHPVIAEWKYLVAAMKVLPQPKVSPIILEVDENGKIVRSFNSPAGKVTDRSEFSIVGKYAYMGTPFSKQLWRISTKDLL